MSGGVLFFIATDAQLLDPEFDDFSVPQLSCDPGHEMFLDLAENVAPPQYVRPTLTKGPKPPLLCEPCAPSEMYRCGTLVPLSVFKTAVIYDYVPPSPEEIMEAKIEGLMARFARYGRPLSREQAVSLLDGL